MTTLPGIYRYILARQCVRDPYAYVLFPQGKLGVAVVSFSGPVSQALATHLPGGEPGDTLGYIPMDPAGIDIFAQEEEVSGSANIDHGLKEQLALQSEGLLAPAFGESVADFVLRRVKELNAATRDHPKDEVPWTYWMQAC